jgi:hypothetical protein
LDVEVNDVASLASLRPARRKGQPGSASGVIYCGHPPKTTPVGFGAVVQAEARRRGQGRQNVIYLVNAFAESVSRKPISIDTFTAHFPNGLGFCKNIADLPSNISFKEVRSTTLAKN